MSPFDGAQDDNLYVFHRFLSVSHPCNKIPGWPAILSSVPHFFYLARCADNSLYAGTCIDLEAREAKHNEGKGAKYTRSRRPIRIIYHETFRTRSAALRREAEVKRWRKGEKEGLAKG